MDEPCPVCFGLEATTVQIVTPQSSAGKAEQPCPNCQNGATK